ncbi:FAD-dependent monooxygenase [Streptomyces sp. NPDC088551]|uniref:FAD-dependent monooxygenase n=1 Tax=unclassified Streptomyces TaxID=2593676 RepID=UPI0033B29A95
MGKSGVPVTEGGEDAQVVIVGGGPVGMLLAAELGAYGVDTVVLEARATTSDRPKATTVHARTVQCLARRGHFPAPDAAAEGTVSRLFHFAGLPGLRITAPAAEPEPLLKESQAVLERSFEARARAVGARVLRGYRVTRARQGPEGVDVTAEGPDGVRVFRAAYLVGADGSRGAVRAWAGITADTRPATVSALMGLVRFTGERVPPLGWHRTRRGWIVTKTMDDGRVLVRALDWKGGHGDRNAPVSLDELRARVSWIAGHDVEMASPSRLSRFSDFARQADRYRAGRVLLAGDAAHVHFPIGGQGLSTGLLDALNLGWKLAFTVRGTAGAGLLDTYHDERWPAARRVIDNTSVQVALMRPGPELDPLRALFAGLLAGDETKEGNGAEGNGAEGGAAEGEGRDRGEDGARHLSDMISGQDAVVAPGSVRSSRWEGRFLRNTTLLTESGPAQVIGLLRGGRPLLLLFGERGLPYAADARGWAHVLRVVRTEPVPALPCAALLVRPDGYVAWAAEDGAADGAGPAEALRHWFGGPR